MNAPCYRLMILANNYQHLGIDREPVIKDDW